MEKFTLGVDFGTSTTAVALKLPDKLPIPLPIGEDGHTTYIPSVVAFSPSAHQALIGEEAERAAGSAFVVHSIKRCLGCDGTACATARQHGLRRCTGTGKIDVPGYTDSIKPEQIARMIIEEALRRAVKVAADKLNLDLTQGQLTLADEVNFGCSSAFNLNQRLLLVKQVAHELGFNRVTLQNVVEEPIAAGIAYTLARRSEGQVLIYDFGGGTFDTAILDIDKRDNRISILAADGEPWLGGHDILTIRVK